MGNPPRTAMHFYSCAREPACSTTAAYNRGHYSAHFGLLQLQPAPSMHQGTALLKAMQAFQILIKLQFWQASHHTGFTSTIFTLPASLLLVSSHHLALPACLGISCMVLSPLKGHNPGLLCNPLCVLALWGCVHYICSCTCSVLVRCHSQSYMGQVHGCFLCIIGPLGLHLL